MFDNKSLRRPIIDPLLLALKSRRVIVALAALIVGLLTLAIPELRALHHELVTLITALALAVIGGFSLEDAARAARERADLPAADVRQLVKDVLDTLLNEIGQS
jgi:uncharacterized membrane-anchored protein